MNESSPLPLSDADRRIWLKNHFRIRATQDHNLIECARCQEPWPCMTINYIAFADENIRLRADLTAAQEERDDAIESVMRSADEIDRLAERLEKAEAIERAAADIFRAITGGWGALQAIGPTHEQLAAYVTASNLAAPKEAQKSPGD